MNKVKDLNETDLRQEAKLLQVREDMGGLSVSDSFRFKQIQKRIDKMESPVEASGVFVPTGVRKENQVEYIDIDKILFPKYEDRSGIDQKEIISLSKSIEAHNLLQPILLADNKDGTYLKLAGRRRIEAMKILGKKKIEAHVYKEDLTEEEVFLIVLHENEEREGLSVYDKVRAVLNLIQIELKIDLKEAKKAVGRANNYAKGVIAVTPERQKEMENIRAIISKSNIKMFDGSLSTFIKHLEVLSMPEKIIGLLKNNKITFGLARVMNRYKDKQYLPGKSFDWCVDFAVNGELSIDEAKRIFTQNLKEEPAPRITIGTKVNKKLDDIKRSMNKIKDEEVLKTFNSELDKLIKNYLSKKE